MREEAEEGKREMQTHFPYSLPSLSLPYSRPQFPKTLPRITPHKPYSSSSSSSSPFHSSSNEPNLELLLKPSPLSPPKEEQEEQEQEQDEALAPFLKFFRHPQPPPDQTLTPTDENTLRYYDPKPGDLAIGVVVSGNENKMDISVGADFLGTMLTKEALPMYAAEMESLVWDGEEGLERGRMGVVREEGALEEVRRLSGRPVVEAGTVVFAEVLGRTLSGRPLLSSRRMYRRVAWHRVRQVLLYAYKTLRIVAFYLSRRR